MISCWLPHGGHTGKDCSATARNSKNFPCPPPADAGMPAGAKVCASLGGGLPGLRGAKPRAAARRAHGRARGCAGRASRQGVFIERC